MILQRNVVIIDAHSICHKMWHGMKVKLASNDLGTEIVYGFLREILHLSMRFNTNQFIFVWDSKVSKRKERYPWYKDKPKEHISEADKEKLKEAYLQFKIIQTWVLKHIGFINNFYQDGYEADDIIAEIVHNYDSPAFNLIVVTRDEDMYQLLDSCTIYNHHNKTKVTKASFRAKYGIDPGQWSQVKRLAGCKSDKVPGIPGIGEKTAIKFLRGELNRGKKFLALEKDLGKVDKESIYIRNKWLVHLPLPGVKEFNKEINFVDESLSLEGFKYVCDRLDIQSFLNSKNIQHWISSLKLR